MKPTTPLRFRPPAGPSVQARDAVHAAGTARSLRLCGLLCSVFCGVLTGCTTAPEADASRRLMAQGHTDEALRVLENASRAQPANAQARNVWVMQRAAVVAAYVRDGDDLRARRELDAAEAQYRHALRVDAQAQAAQTGLAAVQRERQADAAAAEAQAALGRGDSAAAERQVRAVLAEQPSNRSARSVMKQLVEQRARAASAEPTLTGLAGRLVSLELRDAPLRHVFEILAREGQLNFVFDREVRSDARASIAVRDTLLEDALKMLLLTHQLDRKVLNENTLLIYPATQAKQRDYQELVMRHFYLANADAKQTAAMIRAMVKTRDLYTDEKLNLVIMRDTPAAVRLAEQLVAAQDLPEPEVMLEVEVLEVASSLLQDIGTNLPTQVTAGPTTAGGDALSSQALVRLGAGSVRAFVANPLLILNLRQNDGTSNLLANPRIRVKNREKAHVHIGERVPVITTTSTANVGVSSSVNYLETGLKLDVEPNIYLENDVSIKVSLEVSNILEQLNVAGTVSYRLGTRNAATTLRLKDGETQVLAGLINSEDRRSVARVPFLGDVPVFGRLFRNDSDQLVKTEVVLLITPRVVRNHAGPEAVPPQVPSGTEAAPGAQPLRLTAVRSPLLSVSAPRSTGATTAATAPAAPAAPALPLVVAAPAMAAVGDEFTVTFTLLAGNQPAQARVAVAYDTSALSLLGAAPGSVGGSVVGSAAAPGARTPAPPETGQALVDVQSAGLAGLPPVPSRLRFKVVAPNAMQTELGFTVTSSEAISAPPAHALNIVKRP